MRELWNELAKWAYRELLVKLMIPPGMIGGIHEFEVGNQVEEERMANAEKLSALQDEAVANPDWVAHDITGDKIAETFCNRAAAFVASGMGYAGLRSDQYANAQIEMLALDPAWTEDTIERAHRHALRGGLAFLTLVGAKHGHLCSIRPVPMEESSTWGGLVPVVANVGPLASHGIVRASKAFKAADRPLIRAFLYGDPA